MLKNNKVNAVIAFLAAVLLWVYVVGQVNPSTTGKLTGIPVVFAGEDSLAENDLALVDPGTVTVDITIRGDRSDVRKVIANKDRVTAVADVSGLVKGEHNVTLDITVPSSVDLQKSSIEEITIQIDDRISKDIPVEVDYEGAFEDTQRPGNVSVYPESITATGAAATVDSIERMKVVISADELSEQQTSLTKTVRPVDANGLEVGHVSLSNTQVQITAGLVATKKLPLQVGTTGELAEGYEVTGVDAPSTVTLEGPLSVLNEMTEIKAEDIDVSGLNKDVTVDLTVTLPDGVTMTDPEKPQATVRIAEVQGKTWTYETGEIVIDDLVEGYTAAISGEPIKVTVNAEKTTLDTLKKSDIVLHVSAAGLEAGEQEVALTQISNLDAGWVTINPETVTLKITAPEEETDETGTDEETDDEGTADEEASGEDAADEETTNDTPGE